jgi:hypothetical protein
VVVTTPFHAAVPGIPAIKAIYPFPQKTKQLFPGNGMMLYYFTTTASYARYRNFITCF